MLISANDGAGPKDCSFGSDSRICDCNFGSDSGTCEGSFGITLGALE